MEIADLNENLKQVISLRDELKELKKGNRRIYSLREYVDLFHDRLIWTDHGMSDSISLAEHDACSRLDILCDIEVEKFNSAFSVNKTKLLSIVNRYIKDLQLGLQLYDLKENSIR